MSDGKRPPGNVVRLRLPPDPRVTALLDEPAGQAERKARRLGVKRVRRELCRILAEDERLESRDVTRLLRLLDELGPGGELETLVALACDASRPQLARAGALSVLSRWAPERLGEVTPLAALAEQATRLVYDSMSRPGAPVRTVELLLQPAAQFRAGMLEVLEEERRRHGAPAWPLYAPVLEHEGLAELHARLVELLALEAGPETLALVRRCAERDGPGRVEARRTLLVLSNLSPRSPRRGPDDDLDDSDELEPPPTYRVSTSSTVVDGGGDVVVNATVDGSEDGWTDAWIQLRLDGGVRDGGYRLDLTCEEHEATEERRLPLSFETCWLWPGDAARLVLEAAARTPELHRLPPGAHAALAVFRREADRTAGRPPVLPEWLRDALPEDEIESEEAAPLEAWRRFLEHRFHGSWGLDAGDRHATGLAPPGNAAELAERRPTKREIACGVPAFNRDRFNTQELLRRSALVPRAWVRDAAARLAGTPVRERFARQLEVTAERLDTDKRPLRARLYRNEARRVREAFEQSPFVHAMLERSICPDLRTQRLDEAPFRLGMPATRTMLVAALACERPTRRELGILDTAEAAHRALWEAAERRLLTEARPAPHELVDAALPLGRLAFGASSPLEEPTVVATLVASGRFDEAAAREVAPAVAAELALFAARVCGGCPGECARYPAEEVEPLEELILHPAPRKLLFMPNSPLDDA